VTDKTFKELEQGGWVERATAWNNYFALVTNQAIDTILDSFKDLQGKRLLDVGCGTGQLTAAAAKRGARAEGIDLPKIW
jgi:2-polyprenyl-3-methyl-5-hydroxy-6-metoxy-1,4-benzoquinol methylase